VAVLIDQPRWPAHGTRFAHLVSDASLEELHRFAASHGVALRAFDHDHYDVSEARWHDLVAGGARPVEPQYLLRALRGAGLRVRTPDRTPKRAQVLPDLRRAWAGLVPGQQALGEDLLRRWSEPHRAYHDVRHLAQALLAAGRLAGDSPPAAVSLALWFHDAVHDGEAGGDEQASADLAVSALDAAGAPRRLGAEVRRLVLLTAGHRTETADAAGGLVCDADLSVLGHPPARYQVYLRDVRQEYSEVPDTEFRVGRGRVVAGLAARPRLFHGEAAFEWWEAPARANLAAEDTFWEARGGGRGLRSGVS
jgi:predicted metal-dependent HD superfamily phosphohydrolase